MSEESKPAAQDEGPQPSTPELSHEEQLRENARVVVCRLGLPGNAVDTFDAAEQVELSILLEFPRENWKERWDGIVERRDQRLARQKATVELDDAQPDFADEAELEPADDSVDAEE